MLLKILLCMFAVSCFVCSADEDRKENVESLNIFEKIDQLTLASSDYVDSDGETEGIEEVSMSYNEQTDEETEGIAEVSMSYSEQTDLNTFGESSVTIISNEDETDGYSESTSDPGEMDEDIQATASEQFTTTSDEDVQSSAPDQFTVTLNEDTGSTELNKISTDSDQDTTADSKQEEITASSESLNTLTFEETITDETTTEKISDPCDPNPCENGGTCRLRGNDRVECKCPKGTSGKRCERVDWCKILRDDGTTGKSFCDKGEARCVSHQRNRNFTCVCYNRRKEFNYDIGKCKAKDMCTPNPCKNGGICTTSGYKAQCECPEGTYGRTCERVNWCQIKMENGRSGADYCDQGEAKCVENRRSKNFTCVCYNKRLTFDEELMECIEEVKDTEVQASQAWKECDEETIGYDECRDRSAICYFDPYSYIGYACVCNDGSKLEAESCESKDEACSEDSEGYKVCQRSFARCVVDHNDVLGYSCRCPNGTKFDEVNGCSVFITYATITSGSKSEDSQSIFLILIVSLSANILLAFGIAALYYSRRMKKTPMITIEK